MFDLAEHMLGVWLAALIILLAIEGITPQLVSIWFALGAFAALISAIVGAPVWLQIVWFLLISVLSLCFTRPFVKKHINSHIQPTNADMLIGCECIVTEPINNITGTGAVTVGGKIWTARTESVELKANVGDVMEVIKIEGAKLIVRAMSN